MKRKKMLSEGKQADLINSILMYNEDYADNAGVGFIGPTQEELESFTDAELEQEFEFAKSAYEGSAGSSSTDDEVAGALPALEQEPVHSLEDHPADDLPSKMGMGRRLERVQGLPDSVFKLIVAEGAALESAGLLEQFELNYDAIEEAIHEELLREGLAEDVYLPRDEVTALIATMDPDTPSAAQYIDDDSGEILLAAGQKAGSSYVHPFFKKVKGLSRYMDDEPDYEDVASADNVQNQYQAAIDSYAADFEGEAFEDTAGMATDAAEGFFALNPKWKLWAQALGITKADMKSNIAELIAAALVGEGLQLESEYEGRDVDLGKPMNGDIAKFKVYVNDKKTGKVKKVNFGSKEMEIRRDNLAARKSFRARHGCGTNRASDRTKAAYWSCRMWSTKPVSKIIGKK